MTYVALGLMVILGISVIVTEFAKAKRQLAQEKQKAIEDAKVFKKLEAPRVGNIDDPPELPPDDIKDPFRGA